MGPRAEPRVAGDRQQGKADQDALLFPSVCEEQSKANSISEFASQSIGDAKFAWTAWARERALKMKKSDLASNTLANKRERGKKRKWRN